MDMFQLIWKNKSDLGFKELKKNKWIWCSCKKSHWQEIWGCVLFFCHQKHKNNNNKNHRADGCPLKPINNARFRLVFIMTQHWIPGCIMPLKCDPIRLKWSLNVSFYYSFTYSQLLFFIIISTQWRKRAYWLKTSVLLILEISLGLLFFISLYFLSLLTKWIILLCRFMYFSTNTTNVFLFF